MKDIKVLEQHKPKVLPVLVARALGVKAPPVLVTFKDAKGNIRREELPL